MHGKLILPRKHIQESPAEVGKAFPLQGGERSQCFPSAQPNAPILMLGLGHGSKENTLWAELWEQGDEEVMPKEAGQS